MTIGSNIKKLRRERDITQEQLAEKIGTKKTYISRLEKKIISRLKNEIGAKI